MKLRSKPHFVELAAQLLQRAVEEGYPDLALKWGESIFLHSRSAFMTCIHCMLENLLRIYQLKSHLQVPPPTVLR